jgi:hypothetical protein
MTATAGEAIASPIAKTRNGPRDGSDRAAMMTGGSQSGIDIP